jgi:drug/metabolite transporter (DMT)-like permease
MKVWKAELHCSVTQKEEETAVPAGCSTRQSQQITLQSWHLANRTYPRRWTVIVSGLLCGALALVVIYTNRVGLSSPLAIVVLAAIGVLALTLQIRLRSAGQRAVHVPLWLNGGGILFALAALGSDRQHIRPEIAPVLALLAIASFALSSAFVLQGLRRDQPGAQDEDA